MRASAKPFLVAAFAAALALAPAAARAQSQSEINLARQTAGDGLTAYKAGDYAKAVSLFDQARAVYPSAQILRMLGYSHLALERWEKAIDSLEAALASKVGPLGADDRKDVEEQMQKALVHYANVVVKTKAPGAEVVIDAQPPRRLPLDKPVRLFKGKHRFVVHAEGLIDAEREVDLAGGTTVELDLEPRSKDAPAPPPPPPPPAPTPPPARKGWLPHQRAIGIAAAGTGLGVGVAGLVTGLIGAHVKSNYNDDVAIHQKFYGTNCAMGDARLCAFDVAVINNEADQANALQTASLVLYVSGGVLLAGGVVLFVAAPKPQPDEAASAPQAARLRCGIAGGGISCGGAF